MKKTLSIFFTILVISLSSIPSFAVDISIDDQKVQFTEASGSPFIDQANRTQVPFRQTMEAYGCKVSWDPVNEIAIAEKDGITVQVPIGASYIIKNGQQIPNDTAALIKDNHTYLPIRVVLEAFGADVGWNDSTQTVAVYSVNGENAVMDTKDKNNFIIDLFDRLAEKCQYGDKIDRLNENERVIYLCFTFEGEINNGGFDQFFYNSAGDYTEETIDSLLKIGATKTAEFLKTATTVFPNNLVPQNREERQALLEEINNDETEKLLNELDNSFYAYEDDLLELEYDYVMQHNDDFIIQ